MWSWWSDQHVEMWFVDCSTEFVRGRYMQMCCQRTSCTRIHASVGYTTLPRYAINHRHRGSGRRWMWLLSPTHILRSGFSHLDSLRTEETTVTLFWQHYAMKRQTSILLALVCSVFFISVKGKSVSVLVSRKGILRHYKSAYNLDISQQVIIWVSSIPFRVWKYTQRV